MTKIATFKRGRQTVKVYVPRKQTPTNRVNPFAAFRAAEKASE